MCIPMRQCNYDIYTKIQWINKNSMKIKNLKTSTTVYLSPMNWERVYPMGYPTFLFRNVIMPTPSQLGSVVVPCGSLWMSWGNSATLISVAGVPLWLSGSILCQGRWQHVIEELATEGCIPVSYHQWSCYHHSVPWVINGGHSVHYPMAYTSWDIYPPAKWHVIPQTSTPTTCYLKSSPIIGGCSGRCPQEKS